MPKNQSTPAQKAPPDAEGGISLSVLTEKIPFAAQFRGEDILLVKEGRQVAAVGAKCSHFGAPLQQGRVFGGAIHCPWHHAAFCLKNGHTQRAPGLDAIGSWQTRIEADHVYVTEKKQWVTATPKKKHPPQITFVGAGAATYAAILGLRTNGYEGPIVVFGSEAARPYDRIKLSKAYLQGNLEDQKLSLRSSLLEHDEGIAWRLETHVEHLDLARRVLVTSKGEHPFCSLVLATGARPNRLDISGADKPHVHVLRTLEDARRLVSQTRKKQKIVVVGAGFIGLEAAAQMTALGHHVDIVAPKGPPMAHIVGEACARSLEDVHTSHGAVFHWGETVVRIDQRSVLLSNNHALEADRVLLALGVKPNEELAHSCGLSTGNGIHVDEELRTQAKDVFAIGDVASFPSPVDQARLRIEHWSVAEQMGFVVADNLLGHGRKFVETPFFWTEHHDLKLRYVGHVRQISRAEVFGDFKARRAAVLLYEKDVPQAIVTCGRDDIAVAAREALESKQANKLKAVFSGF